MTQSWVYDSNYRLCKKVEPETGQTLYQYDADSKMAWSVAGFPGTATACDNGTQPANAITYTYDTLDRPTKVHYADTTGDVTMSYDLDGHVLTANNPTANWTYTYNKRGLMETEQAVVDGGTYNIDPQYDTQANLSTLTYPDYLKLDYTPDAFGRPTQINASCCGGQPITQYVGNIQYYANGQPSGYGLANGMTVTSTIDKYQRQSTQVLTQGGNQLQNFQYGYSDDSDLTSITESVSSADSATMGYDALHRITSASGVWGSYAYGYDANNNIKTRTGGSGTLTYNYTDGLNRLNSVTGITRNYTYDARGRLNADGLRSYTWNDADQIVNVPGVATYSYDALGKRIKTVLANGTTTYDIYDAAGQLFYSNFSTAGTNACYIQLAGKTIIEAKSGSPTFLHSDLLGSPRMQTSWGGGIISNEHFDPYGAKLNGVQEKVGYTGHAFDQETGLTYAQARFYDAAVGRFMSADPSRYQGGDPFKFNRYAYGNDSPYGNTDPTGMDDIKVSANEDPATGTHLKGGTNINGHVTFGGPVGASGASSRSSTTGPNESKGPAQAAVGQALSGTGIKAPSGAASTDDAKGRTTMSDLKPATFFGHFLGGSGKDVVLTDDQFQAVSSIGKVSQTDQYPDGTGFSQTKDYYGTPLGYTFGTATVRLDNLHQPVGFYDKYDFDFHSRPTIGGQVMTGIDAGIGFVAGGKDFDTTFP